MDEVKEPVSVRIKRQRRSEGSNWKVEDEQAWREKFPDAQPEPWMAGRTEFQPKPVFDPDLIPQPDYGTRGEPDPGQLAVDGIDIIDAYVKWCGKMTPNPNGKRESVMISCPDPNHRDKIPSAWLNLDKQVWSCGRDNIGGDKFTIAGYHFQLDPHTEFPELKKRMAEDLGFTQVRTPAGRLISVVPDPEPEPEPEPTPVQPHLSVVPTREDEDLTELDIEENEINEEDTFIDWSSLIPGDSFLYEWMLASTINDSPDEYLFWLGLQAIAFASGRNTYLTDFQPVRPHLYVCLYGASGTKKSLATTPYLNLIKEALPFDKDPTVVSGGVDILGDVGSTEYFMESLSQRVTDVSSGTEEIHPKESLWPIAELSSFFGRSAKQSTNQLKEKLMELFDLYGDNLSYRSMARSIEVKQPYFQALSTTQPNAIRAYMDKSDIFSGFLNRWVFAYGPQRHEPISHGGTMPDITVAADMLSSLRAWCGTGRVMNLPHSSDAYRKWDDFFKNELTPFRARANDDIFNRIDLQMKKLIVLFCINERAPQPTAEIVEKVISLFPYLRATYGLFSKAVTTTESSECADKIREFIRLNPGTSINRIINRVKNYPREQVLGALQVMEKLDEIQVSAANRGTTTEKRYRLTN